MILDVHDFKHEALSCYEQASELDPEEVRWPYYAAIVRDELGDREALQWYERSRLLAPEYAPLHIRYGHALFNAGQLEKSRGLFQRSVRIDKQSSHAYLGLAKVALAKGNLEKSQQYLEQALAIDSRHREAHGVLAEVLRRQGNLDQAAKELESAEQLPKIALLDDPLYDELIGKGVSAFWYGERARRYRRKGLVEESIRETELGLDLSPNPRGHNYVGNLLRKRKEFDRAIAHYRKAISLKPNYYEAHQNLAQTLIESGNEAEALMWAERSLRLNPKLPDAYLTLGRLHAKQDRVKPAIDILRLGLANTRHFPPIARRLAWLLATSSDAELRNASEALRLAQFVCDQAAFRNAESLHVLAVVYAANGEFAKAIDVAREALAKIDSPQQEELATQIQSHVRLFRANRPYRDNRVSSRSN